jgi:hypothetical protein
MKFKYKMMRYLKIAFLLCLGIVTSCEDVIDVEVPSADPRLVIEASLDWEKGTTGANQTIKLSLSTPFFETTASPVIGASVKVIDEINSNTYIFNDQEDGRYTISNFEPFFNHSYSLEVIYDNEIYLAQETLNPVPEFNRIEQSLEGGFNDEALEVTYYFDDPPNEDNFYLSSFQENGTLFQTLESISDEFTDGNEMFNFFEKDEDNGDENDTFKPGDIVAISLYGISETYYNYVRLIIEQYSEDGDPFSVLPADVRGNCVNQTNQVNFAYGYFRVSEVVKSTYTFE